MPTQNNAHSKKPSPNRMPLRGWLLVFQIYNYLAAISYFLFALQYSFVTDQSFYTTPEEFETRHTALILNLVSLAAVVAIIILVHKRYRRLPEAWVASLLFTTVLWAYQSKMQHLDYSPWLLAAGFGIDAVVILYLFRSKRVAKTFGRD